MVEFWSGVGDCGFFWPVVSFGAEAGQSRKRPHICALPLGHELPHVCDGCGYDVQEQLAAVVGGYAGLVHAW